MAGPSENTPLLTSDDRLTSHDESQNRHLRTLPEKSPFKLAITILRVLTSFLSLSIFGILLATYVLITTGPFDFVSNSEQAVRILAIIVSQAIPALHVLKNFPSDASTHQTHQAPIGARELYTVHPDSLLTNPKHLQHTSECYNVDYASRLLRSADWRWLAGRQGRLLQHFLRGPLEGARGLVHRSEMRTRKERYKNLDGCQCWG